MNTSEKRVFPDAIYNPSNPKHFMRLLPIAARVTITAGSDILAESTAALHLIEAGKDLYAPVVYVPKADLTAALTPIPEMTTHCPLKGDAHYFRLKDEEEPIAWIYDETLPFADALKDHAAFYANRVIIEAQGLSAR